MSLKYGIQVKLIADFFIIKETLERIGVCNKRTKVITPSCYLLHKKGNCYIVHFKELLAEDGHKKEISQKDYDRRDAIATLLENWNLIEIITDGVWQNELKEKIFVLPYKEKSKYKINHKYSLK